MCPDLCVCVFVCVCVCVRVCVCVCLDKVDGERWHHNEIGRRCKRGSSTWLLKVTSAFIALPMLSRRS